VFRLNTVGNTEKIILGFAKILTTLLGGLQNKEYHKTRKMPLLISKDTSKSPKFTYKFLITFFVRAAPQLFGCGQIPTLQSFLPLA